MDRTLILAFFHVEEPPYYMSPSMGSIPERSPLRKSFPWDRLYGETPEIADGCFVIDNTIVVWHVDLIDDAAEAISMKRALMGLNLLKVP